ncbi:MAG: hypothetical protein ABIH42_07245 [Planctomycetota bacterium]
MRFSKAATASLVFSILAVVAFFAGAIPILFRASHDIPTWQIIIAFAGILVSVIAIPLGFSGCFRVRKSENMLKGYTRSVSGIVLGFIAFFGFAWFLYTLVTEPG